MSSPNRNGDAQSGLPTTWGFHDTYPMTAKKPDFRIAMKFPLSAIGLRKSSLYRAENWLPSNCLLHFLKAHPGQMIASFCSSFTISLDRASITLSAELGLKVSLTPVQTSCPSPEVTA